MKIFTGIILFPAIMLWSALYCFAAATYQWTDDAGVRHFTDDPSTVPERYLPRLEKREVEAITPVLPSAPAPPPAAQTDNSAAISAWRARFTSLNRQIEILQQGIPGKQEKLGQLARERTKFHRSADRAAYNKLAAEIEEDQKQLSELEQLLEKHKLEASAIGVPLDMRQ